ncbi:MAG TPA: hypothetical protein PKH84_04625 [Thermomonas sp.]|uniref:Sel1 repeat family protein n=1 Tax=Thermomonas beijingensis TaxID=2872701 RepID=A0ABS7TGR2_9GAMM|nr:MULTISPECIES: hypothetical protein [Thermomonas]MBZ4187059.1 hypothetical protein [Thermomonas beijingensis]MBZ4187064.1 hypothetical protein [Thermomonas beijingensis]HOC10862.1 hypothetical protein [Thermomonas sp.]HOC10867.1 hypothetical protein [Thermomonas sp.]
MSTSIMAKMPLFGLMLAIMLLLGCSGQGNRATEQSATPGDQYLLSPADLVVLQDKADKGDLQAVKKLILYYELAAPDMGKAMHWQRVAANRGDVGAMLNLSTYLAMHGREETCFEAVEWIDRAKSSATDAKLVMRADRKLSQLRHDGPCVKWLKN